MFSVQLNFPIPFIQFLGKKLQTKQNKTTKPQTNKQYIRIKDVINVTWILDIGNGISFWKNDAICLHIEMTQTLYLIFLSVFFF